MKPSTVLSVCLTAALAGCLVPPGAQDGAVPSFYQPGGAADGGVAAAGDQDVSTLAPQERKPVYPDSYADQGPSAGPAPRNSISGGEVDIGVVPADPEGVASVGAPTRGVEPTESGRLYILELYQDVLEQRDALELEVSTLLTDFEAAQARIAELESTTMTDGGRLTLLEQENAELRAENTDLAARLTTAQIRRLEAEKLLLETRIAWTRAQLEGAGSPRGTGIALGQED